MLSKTSRYALGATAALAERWDEGCAIRVGDIAADLDVPRNYLSKILHQLSRAGVLTSERGPKGGFRLARGRRRAAKLNERTERGRAQRTKGLAVLAMEQDVPSMSLRGCSDVPRSSICVSLF